MVAPLLVAVLLAAPAQVSPDRPRTVIRQAAEAVEGDSVAAVHDRWRARLDRYPPDDEAILGLATMALRAGDFTTAEPLYRRLRSAASRGNPAFAAHGYMREAGLLRRRGEIEAAELGYQRARELFAQVEDVAAEAEALHGVALIRLRTGGPSAALEVLDEALRLRLDEAPSMEATLRCERAHLRGYSGRADALAEAELGYRLAKAAGDKSVQLHCLRSSLAKLSQAGAPDSLLRVVERVESLSRETGQVTTLASALTWRATVMRGEWRLDAARSALLEALRLTEDRDEYLGAGWTLLEIGTIYSEAGDYASAASHLARAVQLFELHGERPGLADALLLEANLAMRAGQAEQARSLFKRVLRWADSTQTIHQRIGGRYGLAAAAMRTHDWIGAEAHLDTLDWVKREQDFVETGTGSFARGMIALRQGDLEKAEHAFRHSTETSKGDALHRLESQARLAQVLALRGDAASAETELRRVSDRLDALRSSVAERELRLLAFQRHDLFGEPTAGWPTTLAALVAAGRVEAAFELAERRRGRELFDGLTRARALHDSEQVGSSLRSNAPQAPIAAKIRESIPDNDTAILEFVSGRDGQPTVLFVLTREHLSAHQLAPIDTLAANIRRFLQLIEAGQDPRRVGRQLGSALLAAAARALPANVTRLVIVPDDVLHRVPFDALVLEDDRYLVERYAVSLAPSAMIAAELWRRPAATREPAILAFGDPRFENETQHSGPLTGLYRSAFASDGGLPRLSASGREAVRVGRYARVAEVRLRDRASVAYLKHAQLEVFRVLHFATHARVDESAITRTALALAPSADDDGFIGPAELAALSLDADLVVLSACRTAGGVMLSGEGIQGLSAPLLAAGARSVAATLWPIGDRQTVRLVDDFYRALADGLTTGDALRAAKLAALRRGAPPAEWASFTLVGNSHLRVPLQRPAPRWPVWAIGLTAALVLAAYGARNWKSSSRERG